MSTQSEPTDPTKIEIELISYKNLLNYSSGKSKTAVEGFAVDLNSKNFKKVEEDSSAEAKVQDLLSKIKGTISGQDQSTDGMVRAQEESEFEGEKPKGFLDNMLVKLGVKKEQKDALDDPTITQVKASSDAISKEFQIKAPQQGMPPGGAPPQPPPPNYPTTAQAPSPTARPINDRQSQMQAPPPQPPPPRPAPVAPPQIVPMQPQAPPPPPPPRPPQPQHQPQAPPQINIPRPAPPPPPPPPQPAPSPPKPAPKKAVLEPLIKKKNEAPNQKKKKTLFGTVKPSKSSGFGSASTSPKESKVKDAFVSFGNTLRYHMKKIVMLFFLAGLGVVFFMLPQITKQPEKSSVDIVVEYSKVIFTRGKNALAVLTSAGPDMTQVQLSGLTIENAESIDLDTINLKQVMQRAEKNNDIAELKITKNELASILSQGTFDRFWKELTAKQIDLTVTTMHRFLDDYQYDFTKERIYVLNITNTSGEKIPFSEFVEGMDLKLPQWRKDVSDYQLMVYVETLEEASDSNNQVRLGLNLFFDPKNKPNFAKIQEWEPDMAKNLSNLYMPENLKIVDPAKPFGSSSVSSTRRYVNYTEDQSMSMDYGVTQDGIFIITSNNFGQYLTSVFLENKSSNQEE